MRLAGARLILTMSASPQSALYRLQVPFARPRPWSSIFLLEQQACAVLSHLAARICCEAGRDLTVLLLLCFRMRVSS